MVSLVLKARDTKPRCNTDLIACWVVSETQLHSDEQTCAGEVFRAVGPFVFGCAGLTRWHLRHSAHLRGGLRTSQVALRPSCCPSDSSLTNSGSSGWVSNREVREKARRPGFQIIPPRRKAGLELCGGTGGAAGVGRLCGLCVAAGHSRSCTQDGRPAARLPRGPEIQPIVSQAGGER